MITSDQYDQFDIDQFDMSASSLQVAHNWRPEDLENCKSTYGGTTHHRLTMLIEQGKYSSLLGDYSYEKNYPNITISSNLSTDKFEMMASNKALKLLVSSQRTLNSPRALQRGL
jgi:hypothetical protein